MCVCGFIVYIVMTCNKFFTRLVEVFCGSGYSYGYHRSLGNDCHSNGLKNDGNCTGLFFFLSLYPLYININLDYSKIYGFSKQ